MLHKIAQGRGGAKILGYRIFIVDAGSLMESHFDTDEDAVKYLARVYREMADFWLEYKVKRHEFVNRRYKEL